MAGGVAVTETQSADLAVWLTAVWDEEERLATEADWGIRTGSTLWVQTIGSPGIAPGICASPQHVLARIAADRKILARLRALEDQKQAEWVDYAEWADGNNPPTRRWQFTHDEVAEIPGLRAALRISASPYADREGFRSEWLVERQGVEG